MEDIQINIKDQKSSQNDKNGIYLIFSSFPKKYLYSKFGKNLSTTKGFITLSHF